MQVFGFTLLVFLEQAAQSIWRSLVSIQLIELGHDPMLQLELNRQRPGDSIKLPQCQNRTMFKILANDSRWFENLTSLAPTM